MINDQREKAEDHVKQCEGLKVSIAWNRRDDGLNISESVNPAPTDDKSNAA